MAKTLNFDKIKAHLDRIPAEFAGKEAQMGWFPGARYENGTPVAYVATIQENGAPEVGIPARPFLKPTIAARTQAWTKLLASGVKAVSAGRATADQVLEGVGLQMAGDTKAQIASNAVEPLSPTTLVLRKWRREGRAISGKTVGEAAAAYEADPSIIGGVPSDPLQDTGLMVATLSNAVGKSE
jgi:hypothetical protein